MNDNSMDFFTYMNATQMVIGILVQILLMIFSYRAYQQSQASPWLLLFFYFMLNIIGRLVHTALTAFLPSGMDIDQFYIISPLVSMAFTLAGSLILIMAIVKLAKREGSIAELKRAMMIYRPL